MQFFCHCWGNRFKVEDGCEFSQEDGTGSSTLLSRETRRSEAQVIGYENQEVFC